MKQAMSEIRHVAVIGAGAWGTALARHLANKGLRVRLWAYEPEVVEVISRKRENTVFLPGVLLPSELSASTTLGEVTNDAQLIVACTPSHALRSVFHQLLPVLARPIPIVIATKGIEEGSHAFMSQILEEVFPPPWHSFFTVLTGPSFAAEVSQEKPTTILLAGKDSQLVTRLQMLFMTPRFRVYASSDPMGAQVGGALKNVMAIAAGVVDGLDLGCNARAALITRGLAEMVRLGVGLGGDPHTLYGLSGLGDLVLTCTGPLSRNYTLGRKLGEGKSLADLLKETRTVAEGVRTTQAVVGLAEQLSVEMPIVQNVHAILFEQKNPRDAVMELMVRAARSEREPVLPTDS